MIEEQTPRWLRWAREIQSLAQTGLTYSQSEYDTQRYERLLSLAGEIAAHHSGIEVDRLRDSFAAQLGYATPKIDVRAAVLRDGRILLVQERADSRWAMPGGWADVGDLPSQAAIREVREESGFQVRPTRIVGVYDANRAGRPLEFYHAYKIVFWCEIVAGEACTSDETRDVGFFPPDGLPLLSTNRTDHHHLADVFALLAEPGRPTVFD